jgi:hypothetical protein
MALLLQPMEWPTELLPPPMRLLRLLLSLRPVLQMQMRRWTLRLRRRWKGEF